MARTLLDYARARSVADESLVRFRSAGDGRSVGWALHLLGWLDYRAGDRDLAKERFAEAVALGREAGDRPSVGMNLRDLGVLADIEGDQARARALNDESVKLLRAVGDAWNLSHSIRFAARLASQAGDRAQMRVLLEEVQNLDEQLPDRWIALATELRLAVLDPTRERYDEARARFAETVALVPGTGHLQFVWVSLALFSVLVLWYAEVVRGVRLAAAARNNANLLGFMDDIYRADRESSLAAARTALGEEAYAKAWAEGEAMTLDEAIAVALAVEQSAS